MQHPEPVAHRLFELTEPISLVNFFSPEPTTRWRRPTEGRVMYAALRTLPMPEEPASPTPGVRLLVLVSGSCRFAA